jgi:tRNA nucleotidyltransferase/poly(A) polymerase
MSFDKKRFAHHVPGTFHSLREELAKRGFKPTLVGGAVRDFLLKDDPGHDWDIELRHETLPFEKGAWKDLGKDLSKIGKVSFLPYEIIRIDAPPFQFELSPPRIEIFRDGDKGHSNFEAQFILNLPFEEAIKRRDFTINAMGISFSGKNEMEFLDPLEGLRHLREKVLHYAGPDFGKDPVRFLRAHRFANRFKFAFSPELKNILEHMSLEGITASYLWNELKKSADPVNFLSFLVQEKNKELHIPLDKSLTAKVPEIKKILNDPRKHETWIIALEWVGLSSVEWAKYFSVGTDTSRKLARWAQSSRFFQVAHPEDFQKEFEELRDTENFEKLFDWYFTTKQILQKNPELPLMKMIEEYLPEWIHLYRFEPVKDVKHIDPPYRAKYQVWNLCQRL